jgi:hypothetical protein
MSNTNYGGLIGGTIGAVGGAYVGGPAGAVAGAGIGYGIGSQATGYDPNAGNKVQTASTLTPEQKAYLAQLIGQNAQYMPSTMSVLGSYGYYPQSNYVNTYNEGNFQTGVINPALNTMNKNIANLRHSNNLHSSANRNYQDQVRNKTISELSNLRYNQVQTDRSNEIQGYNNAQSNQLSALTALNNLSGQALGVQGVENIVSQNPNYLDYINTGINAYGAMR